MWNYRLKKLHSLFILWLAPAMMVFPCHQARCQPASFDELSTLISDSLYKTGPVSLVIFNNRHILFSANYDPGYQHNFLQDELPYSYISCWLSAAVLLSLQQDGLLSLDDRISKYIPGFKGVKGDITLLQLLTHTSGLPAGSTLVEDTSLTLQQTAIIIARKIDLIAEPGRVFNFSPLGYQLAGRIAEISANTDWNTLFYERIARPCNMGKATYKTSEPYFVATGCHGTAQDLANFMMMILNDGQFKSNAVLTLNSINLMIHDYTSKLPVESCPPFFQKGLNKKFYGLGIWVDRIRKEQGVIEEMSVYGMNGFSGWLHFCKNTGGVFAMDRDIQLSLPLFQTVRRTVNAMYTDSCLIIRNVFSGTGLTSGQEAFGEIPPVPQKFIEFTLDKPSYVNLKFFDSLGNELDELIEGNLDAGTYRIPLNEDQLYAGMFFYRLKIDGRVETRKILVQP